MGNINEEFKTVAVVSNELEAEIIAGMLRANGIPAEAFGVASSYPSINATMKNQGIQIKVNAEDYDTALDLINNPAES